MKAPLLTSLASSATGLAAIVACFVDVSRIGHLPYARHMAHAFVSLACLALCAPFALAAMVYEPRGSVLDRPETEESRRNQMVARGGKPAVREEPEKPIRALVVGAGAIGRTLAANLEGTGRYNVIGFIDDHLDLPGREKGDILGGRDTVAAIIQQYGVEEVFVAYAPSWQQRLAERLCQEHPEVGVRVVPTAYESMMQLSSVESYGDIAVVRLTSGVLRANEVAKRLFDFLGAFVGLVLLFPISLVTALLIKLTSRGPVLFTQERTGLHGKPFRMYKFRTMTQGAEAATGPVLSSGRNDPRLTPLGRWLRMVRVDEIPQLWNVLRGDMSMVGPRPERPCFTMEYDRTIPAYSRRHQVRPGITGLAQICGGYHTDPRDKLRFDLIYISHQSLLFDISLLMRTVLVCVLPHRQKFDRNDPSNG